MLSFTADAWKRFWEQRALYFLAGIPEKVFDLFHIPTPEELEEEKTILFGLDQDINIGCLHYIGCDFSSSTLNPDPENHKLKIYDHIIEGWQKTLLTIARRCPNDFVLPMTVNRHVWPLSKVPVPPEEFIRFAFRNKHFLEEEHGGLVNDQSNFYTFLKVSLTEAIAFAESERYQRQPIPVKVSLICDGAVNENKTRAEEVVPLLKQARQLGVTLTIRGFVNYHNKCLVDAFRQSLDLTDDELKISYYTTPIMRYNPHQPRPQIDQGHSSVAQASKNAFDGLTVASIARFDLPQNQERPQNP